MYMAFTLEEIGFYRLIFSVVQKALSYVLILRITLGDSLIGMTLSLFINFKVLLD